MVGIFAEKYELVIDKILDRLYQYLEQYSIPEDSRYYSIVADELYSRLLRKSEPETTYAQVLSKHFINFSHTDSSRGDSPLEKLQRILIGKDIQSRYLAISDNRLRWQAVKKIFASTILSI